MSSYLKFDLVGNTPSGLTSIYNVLSVEGHDSLGQVKWFGAWRKYTFTPRANTVYDPGCLREIADFMQELTVKHRGKK